MLLADALAAAGRHPWRLRKARSGINQPAAIMQFMTEPNPAEALIRLENLITADLHEQIDPMNRAAVIGWGLFFHVAHQVCAILTLHKTGVCAAASPNRRCAL
ncbi:hypothetical protein [Streptomyces sp. HUAS TT20]|uniref:hypothetical protein n=1 Tax=Streptomyces sp. HUAS TT20 TaxID=3447509 RepID=UPI0021D7E596|nr:hypothetical protein [Streptomyces sp. HUAS 15-9]UXY31245.1 hypothetical protein N8I87_35000 [Streptomyces sp. HUAS 15-9]